MVPSDPLKCTIVFNVLCKKNQCVVETCWPMWDRSLTPSLLSALGRAGCLSHLQGADCSSPFSPKGVLPPPLISLALGFSLLETLKKDGPGQRSGHSQAAQPSTCGPWKVYVNIVLYFSSSNTFLTGCLFAPVWLSPLAAQSCFPALPLSVFGLCWATALPDQPPA